MEKKRINNHLEGVRVLDLTTNLSGPYAAQNLSAMGAEVIKIERPYIGDPCRWNPPYVGPDGVTFEMKNDIDISIQYLRQNRKKKSIFLNLKSENGKEIFKRLVKMSHVVMENFSPGTMQSLGLDYSELKKVNPKIIFCSISGYGQNGPYRERTAFDLTVAATSGIMGIPGFSNDRPMRSGTWMGHMIPAMWATIGILAALISREKTGRGERIDISMQDACFSMATDDALDITLSTGVPERKKKLFRMAPWNAYPAKDGYIVICVSNNTQWKAFLEAIGREELKRDPRFKNQQGRYKHADEIDQIVIDWLKDLTREDALRLLRGKKVPCEPIAGFEEALEDPQLRFRGMIQEAMHPVCGNTSLKVTGFPIKFSELKAGFSEPAPYPGQHNEEIYMGLLGLSKEHMEKLKEEEII
ncbi:MAG: CoA transferase [Desulfobacteraceae bacterium]|nr:CoA transferase [Desulfobacteraceae bacterium]